MNDITQRRRFLKLAGFLTVSSAGALLAGCSHDSDENHGLPDPDPTNPQKPAGTYGFPAGIASGDPREDSIVLWTRLGTDTPSDVELVVQLSTVPFNDKSFTTANILVSVPLTAHKRYHHTVRHRVEGLQPGTHYWYRFVADNDISVQGRTKTAPAANAETALNFAYLSCQDWSANHWAAYDLLAGEAYDHLDLIVHLGDYIYETADSETFQQGGTEPAHTIRPIDPARLSGIAPNGTRYAQKLDDYRYLYDTYRSDARIQAVHAKFPMIAIWDDHEFTDDAWKQHETYSNDNLPQPDRRRSANQAWFEFMPVTMEEVAFSPDTDSYENISIYRQFAFGKVMQLIMTDERLYRDDHAIPEADGETALKDYLSRILKEIGDLSDPNGLYQFIRNTRIMFFGLEGILNDAINKGTLPLGLTLDGIDLKSLKPQLITLLNGISPSPISESDPLNIDKVLTILGQADSNLLLGSLSISGLGSRYAALGEVLRKFLERNANSQYAMLGRKQTNWWSTAMSAAQQRGAVWKVWGNEVSFMKMNLDVNRLRNQGLQLSGSLSLLSSVLVGLVGVLKYLLTSPEVRTTLAFPADYTGNGSATSAPGQKLAVFADSWDGYPDARDYLSNYLVANKVSNVIAITGDLHTFMAGQVTDQGSGQAVMLDFAGAGVSSNSFGGLAGSLLGDAGSNALLQGLQPLLNGRGKPSGMLADLLLGVTSREDKSNDGRDLFARLLMHFSDEVQWAEGICNGFCTVSMDMAKTRVTFHNLRVERDEDGRVRDPASYAITNHIDDAYERRSSFTVYAQGTPAEAIEGDAAVWPTCPPRRQEYEHPAASPEQDMDAPVAMQARMMQRSVNQDLQALRDGVSDYVQVNPANPFAQVFLESIGR